MKVLIQRVIRAHVSVDKQVIGRIGDGMVVFVGIAAGDGKADIDYLVNKLINLRIFADADGKFNLSLIDIHGGLLIISQFTLIAETRKGRRPSFTGAASPEEAEKLFDNFVVEAEKTGVPVARGQFQAHMQVELVNDGPVTLMLDSRDRLLPR